MWIWLSRTTTRVRWWFMATKKANGGVSMQSVGWTIRMPLALAAKVRARAVNLTARGQGKWTGNMVMVDAIANAVKTWGEEK